MMFVGLLLAGCGEPHFCASDGECKGNRICVRSVCEDPPGDGGAADIAFVKRTRCDCHNTYDCVGVFGDEWNGKVPGNGGLGTGTFSPECVNGTCWATEETTTDAGRMWSIPDAGVCVP